MHFNLLYHGMNVLGPHPDQLTPEYEDYLMALLENKLLLRLWQLTSTKYILDSQKKLAFFATNKAFRVKTYFDIDRHSTFVEKSSSASEHVVLDFFMPYPGHPFTIPGTRSRPTVCFPLYSSLPGAPPNRF